MSGRGLKISVDGLEELGADMSKLAKGGLEEAIRRSLRGAGGNALALEMKARSPRLTGDLVAHIGVHSQGDAVLVGYHGGISNTVTSNSRDQKGVWVESGTKPHTIRAGARNSAAQALYFGGKYVEEVHHPGARGRGVAQKSIRAAQWEVESDIVDQIDAMIGGH
jgi:hypothetical protein